ncbi:MAG TPA: hypothetical protein VF881_03340 [Polyangiaceae bacterium]
MSSSQFDEPQDDLATAATPPWCARPAHADRALELATPAPDGAAVLRSHELGMHIGSEKRPQH